jgi:leucine dehydrogenase
MGIKACVKEKFKHDSLKGIRVAVQGLGNVGYNLVDYLHQEQAVITVCDIDPVKTKNISSKYGCEVVAPDKIYDVDADIFAPCAMGAVINDETLPRLKFKVVAGEQITQRISPWRLSNAKESYTLRLCDQCRRTHESIWLEGYS